MKNSHSLVASTIAALLIATLLIPTQTRGGPPQNPGNQGFSTGLTARMDSSGQMVVSIPGPITAFQRIAAISRKATAQDILPFLARNVMVDGYHNAQDRNRKPTEFLKLLDAYLDQARELQSLADSSGNIRVSGCSDSEPLLRVLGYRWRNGCSRTATLETADPERAFLTVDSAFPLVDLEEAIQGGTEFNHAFGSSPVPVLFSPKDWAWTDQNLIDTLLEDPRLARLYWSMSRLDENAAMVLRESPGLRELIEVAPVLDFYGSHLAVRNGKVLVPGGEAAENSWRDLVGASPSSPTQFLVRLLTKDDGWVAAYFDALWYVPPPLQEYFTDSNHLKRYYEALRGKNLEPSPSRSVFRPTANLYLLTSRLLLTKDGKPHVPGNLEVWKEIFRRKSSSRAVRDWAKKSGGWRQPEQLLEAMMSLTRVPLTDGPLQAFLQLIEMDRQRPVERRLGPVAVREMADKYSRFHDQYLIFSEFGELEDEAILQFLTVANSIDKIRNSAVRANALGMFQSNLGLWQILARQGQIPRATWNASFQRTMQPFSELREMDQVYAAGRTALQVVWESAGASTPITQDGLISLLAGPSQTDPESQAIHASIASQIHAVMDSQRLVSLTTLVQLGDGITQMVGSGPASDELLQMAGEVQAFEMPLPIFSNRERSEWASGLQHNPHSSLRTNKDLVKELSKRDNSPKDLTEIRGVLTPFLRDTLVGLNYAYYEPPGAQMVRNNPLFVRSHNFSGQMTMRGDEVWQTPRIFGRGWSASGGAHLAGSISELPYVLAQVEQDFIVPENVQSLIWADLVPTMLTSAVLPRWWNVTREELQAVALYQGLGEEATAAAAENADVRQLVMEVLGAYMLPRRERQVEEALRQGGTDATKDLLMPSELFFLGAEFFQNHPARSAQIGEASTQLSELRDRTPDAVQMENLSAHFGVPHPQLAQTYSRELLEMKPLPTFLGYSSRLLAESWESTNLYWARLAAEKDYHPAALNELVPTLTRRMVEKIFATHLEDWPAVLRAMRETAEEFRRGQSTTSTQAATGSGMPE